METTTLQLKITIIFSHRKWYYNIMQPKKFSEYTPITETDGSEVIPILKAGVNATVKSEDLPISTATQTAIDAADADIAAHIADVANPHEVTKAQVGLGNADNTSDVDKPISTATQTALDAKATNTALDAHTNNTSNPHSVTKSQVGLGSVDNTSDIDKPVSTAQATAIALKADKTYVDTQDALKANQATTYTKTEVDALDAAHVAATDPHTQYMNSDRGDARYAGKPYAVMAKSQFASLPSSYGILGRIFGNDGYKNDLQVYGLSTQASTPTPDAPVPIVSTTGNVTVRSDNKNLARVTATPITKNGISYGTDTTTGLVTFSGTSTAQDIFYFTGVVRTIPIVAGQTYRISQPPGFSGATWFAEGSVLYNNGTTLFPSLTSFTAADNGMAMLYLVVRNGQSPSNISYYPQLEVGATSTAFEKNTNSTQTLPLGSTQLRSLPNGVSDRIYKSGGSWWLEQNVGSLTLDGSEAWSTLTTTLSTSYGYFYTTAYDALIKDQVSPHPVTSDKFATFSGILGTGSAVSADSISGSNTADTARIRIFILLTRLSANTTAAFKTWLGSNNSNVLYQLTTPITTAITDPTLITALENIRTYQGVTNITASTPVSGSYGLDVTNALAGKVDTTGNQTIAGVKTFTSAPIAPSGTSIGGVLYLTGTGFPNGVVTAPTGSIYIDTAITNGASSWIKKSGTGNTGWKILEGDTGQRDITASVINGWTATKVFVRRVNNEVYLQVEGLNAAAMTNTIFTALSAGFRGYSNSYVSRMMLHTGAGPVAAWRVNIEASGGVYVGNSTTATPVLYGLAPFPTLDDWPSSLPGTAA
jgi:hypothetical protein